MFLLSGSIIQTQAAEDSKNIADRDIYLPSTVSPEARVLLKQLSLKKGYARVAPEPADLVAWQKMYEGAEAANEESAQKAIKDNNVTVTKIICGIPVLDIRPKNWTNNGKVLVYTHGGAYTLFSARSTLPSSAPMARITGMRVISVDYTTAPFAHWEEIQEQVISVFKALLAEGYTMNDIAIYGDSAGGGLTTSTVLNLRDRGMGMPEVVVLFSPWVDITNAGDTPHTLKEADPTLNYELLLKNSALAYADDLDLDDPRVSPLYANFSKGFPPTLIQGGTKEILLSTVVRLYQKMEAADQKVKLDIYEGMPHVFQQFGIPESEVAMKKAAAFIHKHMGI